MRQHKKTLFVLLIVLASFLIRLYFVFTDTRLMDGDQAAYVEYAMSLLQRHEFADGKGNPTAYITPLYPVFLSTIYFFFGHSYLWVRIWQALLGSIVCFVVYLISKEIFNEAAALTALLLMGIHYFFISYGMLVFSENLFIFLVGLNTLCLLRFCKNPSYIFACLFGATAGLATLTRSAYFFFPFMAVAILFLMGRSINIGHKKLLKFAAVMIISSVIPVSVWTARNYFVFRSFVPLGTEAGVVFYAAYNPHKGKILDACIHDDVTLKTSNMTEIECNRYLLRQTLMAVKKDPSKIYRYIPLRLMYFFSVFDWAAFKTYGAYNFSTAFILPLSFFGIFISFRRKDIPGIKLIALLPVIYFLLVTMFIMGVPRTRLPVEPYLIIFAAFFVNYACQKSRFKLITAGAFGFWYFLNWFIYLNSGSAKAIARGIFQKIGLW